MTSPVFVLCSALVATAAAGAATPFPYNDTEMSTVLSHFLANVDMSGTGAVVAAPSKSHPNYWYHWVRDAAISMNVLHDYGGTASAGGKYERQFKDYVNWVTKAQLQSDPNPGQLTLGEPKFFLSGVVFNGAWCRPQNDGAALRAIALINLANDLLKNGGAAGREYVTSQLYSADLSNPLPIKRDLEFVAHHWSDQSCDPWEEIFGDHFFTKYVQRKVLIDGAALATTLSDAGAANFYDQQAGNVLNSIDQNHWNAGAGIVEETPAGYVGPPKYELLDVAVILGSLYGSVPGNDGGYGPTDPRILSTAAKLQDSLRGVYGINAADDGRGLPGFLIGRYPNDTYNGYETGQIGNPWILCTNAVGELYYRNAAKAATAPGLTITPLSRSFFAPALRMAGMESYSVDDAKTTTTLSAKASLAVAEALLAQGDGYITRVKAHTAGNSFHFSEQINRDTGYMQGANDLTWSYGTLLAASKARTTAAEAIATAHNSMRN